MRRFSVTAVTGLTARLNVTAGSLRLPAEHRRAAHLNHAPSNSSSSGATEGSAVRGRRVRMQSREFLVILDAVSAAEAQERLHGTHRVSRRASAPPFEAGRA